jgi:thioredoxin-related protein
MKTTVLLFIGLVCWGTSLSQKDSRAAYLRFPTIPPIDLVQLDNTHLTKEGLLKDKKTLIMFFSPTCEHCQHQMRDMLDSSDLLKDVEIVLATYQPVNEIQEFFQKYELAKYKNIKIGRDEKFMLPPYFRMKNLPYLALYHHTGDLLTTFDGNVSVEKLVKTFTAKD